jgi:uncharacterized membrane protein (UPF0182 family)
VLALQDRLAYGPTFEAALRSLFGGEASSLSSTGELQATPRSEGAPQPSTDFNVLVVQASKDFADYQRLTAEGKLAEAGQKLDELKRVIDQLNAHQK